jgi:hypothetical protein
MKLSRSVRAALTPFVMLLTAAVVPTYAGGQSAQRSTAKRTVCCAR